MKWAIISNQVTKVNPKGGSIGRQNDGRWATGSLKEYPPAMNKALAGQFCEAISCPNHTDRGPR